MHPYPEDAPEDQLPPKSPACGYRFPGYIRKYDSPVDVLNGNSEFTACFAVGDNACALETTGVVHMCAGELRYKLSPVKARTRLGIIK